MDTPQLRETPYRCESCPRWISPRSLPTNRHKGLTLDCWVPGKNTGGAAPTQSRLRPSTSASSSSPSPAASSRGPWLPKGPSSVVRRGKDPSEVQRPSKGLRRLARPTASRGSEERLHH